MTFALAQEGKKLREHEDFASFEKLWFQSITQHEVESSLIDGVRTSETSTESDSKNDPDREREGRFWTVTPVARGILGWGAIAWCAAFVNWCLKQAGEPHLGVATARSWLKYGTTLPEPRYGCIAVIPSPKPTAGAGQVAFFLGIKKGKAELLGGFQSNSAARGCHEEVIRYCWPTSFNRYLLNKDAGS